MMESWANFADVPALGTEFPSARPCELEGLVLELKYCEWCGKTFLRSQGRKDTICPTCSTQSSSQRTTPSLAAAVRAGIAYLELDPDTRTGGPRKPYVAGNLLRMICLAGNVAFSEVEAQRLWPWLARQIDLPCSCANSNT